MREDKDIERQGGESWGYRRQRYRHKGESDREREEMAGKTWRRELDREDRVTKREEERDRTQS